MTFQALLVSKDEQASEVLTPLLNRCGVAVAVCGYPEASCRLTEEQFDAVIVDFDDPHRASLVLQSASPAAPGITAVTVALLSDKTKVRSVLGAGANFILYKPISDEQADASLRAATALIKRERRRSFRVPVQVPIELQVQNGPPMEGILLDLSEDGMDVLAAQALCPGATISGRFNLLDSDTEIQVSGEIAWASPNGQVGVRFIDLSRTPSRDSKNMGFGEFTGNSASGSRAGIALHFDRSQPRRMLCRNRISVSRARSSCRCGLKAEDMEVEAEGLVRVMHPGFGMGIEFAARTTDERAQVARFIRIFLTSRPGTYPALLITPRTLAAGDDYTQAKPLPAEELEDSRLELLRGHESFNQEEFLLKLRQQRNSEEVASS